MKAFEVKLTLRLYDTELVSELEKKFKDSGERFESKNQFLTQLIKLGLESLKPKTIEKELGKSHFSLECHQHYYEIQQLFKDMHSYNKQQVETLLAHLSITEKMSAAIYHMLLAIMEDESLSKIQIEAGFYDDLPERLVIEMKNLIDDLTKRFKKE